eukprot:jgi/Ulvmu1/7230/UM035_0017.1
MHRLAWWTPAIAASNWLRGMLRAVRLLRVWLHQMFTCKAQSRGLVEAYASGCQGAAAVDASTDAPRPSTHKWLNGIYNRITSAATPYYHIGFIPAVIAVGMLCTEPRPAMASLLSPM